MKKLETLPKTEPETRLAKIVARILLTIRALTFKSICQTPYTWACGMRMRIYNDNRMLLANFEHRHIIARMFISLIRKYSISPDFIIGTMTSGVAPAASVAQYMKKKLLFRYKEEYIVFNEDLCFGEDTLGNNVIKKEILLGYLPDVIITTTPFALVYGTQWSNNLEVGLAYVRSKKKGHGKDLLIEGILKKEMRYIFLFSEDETMDEVQQTTKMLDEELGLVFCAMYEVKGGHHKATTSELFNTTGVVIEDLFSTGGSAAMEVFDARETGMYVNHCFSIFTYGFDCLKRQFSGIDPIGDTGDGLYGQCQIDSLLDFPTLMQVVKETNFFDEATIEDMEDENSNFDARYEKFLAEKNG